MGARTIRAQVTCAAVLIREPVVRVDRATGEEVVKTKSRRLTMGQIDEVPVSEYERLRARGSMQLPNEASLPDGKVSTPNAVPFESKEQLKDVNPRTERPDRTPKPIENAPETVPVEPPAPAIDIASLDLTKAEDLAKYIEHVSPNAGETVALAEGDPERAQIVLEAERTGASRKTVIEPLEELIEKATAPADQTPQE